LNKDIKHNIMIRKLKQWW